MADLIFEHQRLAEIYDPLDPDRRDLVPYLTLVSEFDIRTVLDVGCGTGTYACLLSQLGIDVVAIDPAAASLAVARTKTGADRVQWIHGDVTALPPIHVDLATMTANVAQVFITDQEWNTTLTRIHDALGPGGHLVFEVRDPAKQAWLAWNKEQSLSHTQISGAGTVTSWVELIHVSMPLVSFRWHFVFESDGSELTSDSTLRFRERHEIVDSLQTAGFTVDEIRDAPDRPGMEFVFVARRPT